MKIKWIALPLAIALSSTQQNLQMPLLTPKPYMAHCSTTCRPPTPARMS